MNWFSCALRIENPAQSASNDSKEKSTPDGVSPPQVFAYGEDTHALRLTSELADLRAGYVNWCAARTEFKSDDDSKGKKKALRMECFFRWRRHPDLNWGIRVLKTRALPLGYGAVFRRL